MTTKRAFTGAEASPRATKKHRSDLALSATMVHTKSLLGCVGSAFNDPSKYPDLTITCSGRTWYCHKMVLTARSDWFQTACSGKFREGGAGTIAVEEENLDAFHAMLGFCYGLDPSATAPLSILFCAQLFGLGEKYLVEGLTGVAAGHFMTALRKDARTTEDISAGIGEVYEYTSDVDKVLKGAVLDVMMDKNQELMGGSYESFYHQLLDSIPEFAADMAKALSKSKITTQPKDGDQGGKGAGWYRCYYGVCGSVKGCTGTIYSGAVLNDLGMTGAKGYHLKCFTCQKTAYLYAHHYKRLLST